MKGLPLILTFALLGVNTPFSALPAKPVTEVKNDAEWDAMFSSETMANVTYSSKTTFTDDDDKEDYETFSVTLQDGYLQEFRFGGEEGFSMLEEYLPEQGLLLNCSFSDEGNSFYYSNLTPEGWAAMSNFYLEGQYAGRFEEAVYDRENGCYVLTGEDTVAEIYAEDGRLVKLIDSMTLGAATYSTESLYTDYGTTVVTPMPAMVSTVNPEQWAYAFSGEGLKNHLIDTFGENASGDYSSYLVVGSNTATLSYYGASTEENPDGLRVDYGYKSIEGGVASFCYQDYHWELSSLDPEITWEDAILEFTGLGGLAGAFDSAVYDEASGCYILTLNRLGEDETYTVFFADGELSYMRMESESVTSSTVFSSFTDNYDEDDWIPASAYAVN